MKKAIVIFICSLFFIPFLFGQDIPETDDDFCSCNGTYVHLTLYYFGKDSVKVTAFRDETFEKPLHVSSGESFIKTGDSFFVRADSISKPRLDTKTYLLVSNGKDQWVTKIRTSCPTAALSIAKESQEILGKAFGDFMVLSHIDTTGKVCSLADIETDWRVGGNLVDESVPDSTNALGTKNYEDLVFITNDQTRLTITKDGEIIIGKKLLVEGNLEVRGDSVLIHRNLYARDTSYLKYLVGEANVVLNATGGDTQIKGETTIGGNEKNLTNLTGNLLVDEAAIFKADVNIQKNLNVEHTTNTKRLHVRDNVPDNSTEEDNWEGGFVATFENTDSLKGDGIKIKLGNKRANNFVGNSTPNPDVKGMNKAEMDRIKKLITSNSNTERAEQLALLLGCKSLQDQAYQARLAVGVGNHVINFINKNMPSVSRKTILSETSLELCLFKKCVGETIPEIFIPALTFGVVPTLDLESLINVGDGCVDLSEIDLFSLDTWGLNDFNFELSDPSDILDNQNEFIQFTDNQDKRMGAIRAESFKNWGDNYLNPIFLYKLKGAWTSSKEAEHAKYHFRSKLFEAMPTYLNIGVEYSSGNGDYAEWLERLNPKEAIGSGDIVAVKGGKITKDLSNAEQVMAVSHHPIVLGNIPEEGKAHLGNNIAFMGQVPVKIMGPVSTGDYIVGKGDIQGYGVAVSPEHMTLEDFQLAVGRAWESDLSKGPKMVNTVIGVHNGDYLNILKRYDEKIKASEARLEAVEAKVDRLSDYLLQEKVSN